MKEHEENASLVIHATSIPLIQNASCIPLHAHTSMYVYTHMLKERGQQRERDMEEKQTRKRESERGRTRAWRRRKVAHGRTRQASRRGRPILPCPRRASGSRENSSSPPAAARTDTRGRCASPCVCEACEKQNRKGATYMACAAFRDAAALLVRLGPTRNGTRALFLI